MHEAPQLRAETLEVGAVLEEGRRADFVDTIGKLAWQVSVENADDNLERQQMNNGDDGRDIVVRLYQPANQEQIHALYDRTPPTGSPTNTPQPWPFDLEHIEYALSCILGSTRHRWRSRALS